MFRTSLFVAGALLLSASSAFAQRDASAKVQPITSQVKHAGTYHVGNKTWSRNPLPSINLGPDTLYNNTCSIGFFVGLSTGETLVDSGRVPGTTSPTSPTSVTGSQNSYLINGLQYGYCTTEGPTVDVNVSHIECYAACAGAFGLPTVSALTLQLPGSPIVGSQICWIVDIDLENTPQAFNLTADCNGTFDASNASDNFGWTMLFTTNPVNGPQGPILAGDPFGILMGGANSTGCPYGDGTVWQNPTLEGTGVGTGDSFESYDTTGVSTCWFFGGYFGGNPYSSFWHEMYGDADATPVGPMTSYCNANGVDASPCPCGNNNNNMTPDGDGAGCRNTNNMTGGMLRATGSDSISAGDLQFQGSNMDTAPGLYFQGDNQLGGGLGNGFGDGLRCAGINVVRIQTVFPGAGGNSNTTVNVAATGGVSPGQTKHYQLWYRNPNITLCGSTFNLTNAGSITWTP